MDIMYVPDSNDHLTRHWHVVDQSIPTPMPIRQKDLQNPFFISSIDGVNIPDYVVKRFSSFRAYHDNGYFSEDEITYNTRLLGRSVWNSRWLLIIPGETFLADSKEGLDTFIHGKLIPGTQQRDNNGVTDIKLFFQTYAISGG
jgi:hypothetical protein